MERQVFTLTTLFNFFVSEIEKVFPSEKDRFLELLNLMESFLLILLMQRRFLLEKSFPKKLKDPLLEMLLCPTCYYGSARPNDIDFPTFIMLFDAIFKQGLSRPEMGNQSFFGPDDKKIEELGVEKE